MIDKLAIGTGGYRASENKRRSIAMDGYYRFSAVAVVVIPPQYRFYDTMVLTNSPIRKESVSSLSKQHERNALKEAIKTGKVTITPVNVNRDEEEILLFMQLFAIIWDY
jgi:hypothetical protein